jgi:hypothetical protein
MPISHVQTHLKYTHRIGELRRQANADREDR